MATLVSAAVTLPFSKSTASIRSSRTSILTNERVNFNKVPLHYRSVSAGGRLVSIRAQMTIETASRILAETEKRKVAVEKKLEGAVLNKFTPETPFMGRCLRNTTITGDDAPDEICHIVFYTGGEFPYKEGQALGVIADGVDHNGNPHKAELYFIASSARGDFGDSKILSLCVRRVFNTNDQGELVPGVTSNFLCDLKPAAEAKITGLSAIELLMPKDPNATIIMLATGTGIAPFRGFLWKMFFEKHDDYKFEGLAWLFFGVPTCSSLIYKEELEKMKEMSPENFRLDYAINNQNINIPTRMAQYGDELWELLQKDNTFVYMCGLKDMKEDIEEFMVSLAAANGVDWDKYEEELKKEGRWNVVVY